MTGLVLFADTMQNVLQYVFGPVLFILSLFLILLVLVQRGRGGGLAGALGGMGGQSAFGSKAGDVFTMITVVTSSIWVLVCCLAIACLNPQMRVPPPNEPTVTGAEDTGSSDAETVPPASDKKAETESSGTQGADATTSETGGASDADASDKPSKSSDAGATKESAQPGGSQKSSDSADASNEGDARGS